MVPAETCPLPDTTSGQLLKLLIRLLCGIGWPTPLYIHGRFTPVWSDAAVALPFGRGSLWTCTTHLCHGFKHMQNYLLVMREIHAKEMETMKANAKEMETEK